jgi:sugar phosphate isomerase/epimerase
MVPAAGSTRRLVATERLTVPIPLAVQLYTFRDPARFGADGMGLDVPTLTDIAAAGFLAVETVDVPGGDAIEARRVLADLDLAVTSSHTWADLNDREGLSRAFDAIGTLGSPRVIVTPRAVATREGVDALIEQVGVAAQAAASHGLRLAYHNHDTELADVDGTPIIDRLAAGLGDAVDFQIDIFWVVVGGQDPAAVIRRLGESVVSLHLKDGASLPRSAYAGEPFVNVPVGSGVVDPEPAIRAAEGQTSVEWLIVEFDHVEGSPIEATGRSLDLLVERGLGRRRTT